MTTKLADALDKLAEAIAQTAIEIRGVEAKNGGPAPATAPSFDELPPDQAPWEDEAPAVPSPSGSAAVCPAHGVAYLSGKFGPYCPSQSTEPGWSNQRGYCTITPKNAAAYLRKKAGR